MYLFTYVSIWRQVIAIAHGLKANKCVAALSSIRRRNELISGYQVSDTWWKEMIDFLASFNRVRQTVYRNLW